MLSENLSTNYIGGAVLVRIRGVALDVPGRDAAGDDVCRRPVFISESPAYLDWRCQSGQAADVLTKLVRADPAQRKVKEIDASLAADHHKPRLKDLLDPEINRTTTFPVLLATVGLAGAYGLYTFGAILPIVFVIRMVHETRGIELEDMQG